MRGIIVSPEYHRSGENGIFFKRTDIDERKLRQYVLYWDKLDFPDNNIISIGGSPEIEYLESEGVLQRTTYTLNSFNSDIVSLFSRLQLETFRINNETENGNWSLAQPNSELFLPKDQSVITRNLEVQLYQSIPIPTSEVSLGDILTFKENRKDELLEFRGLMDDFYFELINSGDSERALISYVERVQRKIIEIDRVMNESKMSTFKGSVKIQFDLKKALKNTLIGGIGGSQFGFPTLGSTLGFASSFINITSEMSLKPKVIPNELKDYAYLYYADKELR